MKNTFPYLAIFGLFLVAIGIGSVVRSVRQSQSTTVQQANSINIPLATVVQTHSGQSTRDWTRFNLKGALRYQLNVSTDSQRQFERQLTLSGDGSVYRYERVTLNTSQSYLFDGKTIVRTTSESGTQLEVKELDGVEAASIRFQIATAGLVPILKLLSDPGTKVIYAGRTSKGDRFEVTTNSGSWSFYVNANHLIDRLEVGEINITYGDYRAVDGLTLPYYQKVAKGETSLYDIKFDTFELNPAQNPNYAKS
jgi:hypothetical protein